MPQHRLPEALGEYSNRQPARFHMPGHKGRGMGAFFSSDLIGWDVTELSVSDNLYNPEDSLLQAQEIAAATYSAAHTFFLINGSTTGLHAMMLSLPQGAKILMGRDCHKAALAGAALANHTVSFVRPPYIAERDLFGHVTPDELEKALKNENADAVLITSPNYYGLCADIPALSEVAHRHGALLLVDAAHGAHFPFSDKLPDTPSGYADMWVNSAHKTLNALGQAALLHIGSKVSSAQVQRALSLLQTSSPSYLLMASLDWARYTAGLNDSWSKAVEECCRLGKSIGRVLGVSTLSASLKGQYGVMDMDYTRLVIDLRNRGVTGYEAQRRLEHMDIFVELSDFYRLVLICTPSDDPRWYPQLLHGLAALPYQPHAASKHVCQYPDMPVAAPLCPAMRAPAMECPLKEAKGFIAAGTVGVYPPGIPLWVPGERITEEGIAFLCEEQALGASLFGVTNENVFVVK